MEPVFGRWVYPAPQQFGQFILNLEILEPNPGFRFEFYQHINIAVRTKVGPKN